MITEAVLPDTRPHGKHGASVFVRKKNLMAQLPVQKRPPLLTFWGFKKLTESFQPDLHPPLLQAPLLPEINSAAVSTGAAVIL